VRLATFATLMRGCDPGLEDHAARVGSHAEAVARRLGWSDGQLQELRVGAALHDLGKIAVPPEVLEKPQALDEDELAHIRAHPVEGAWLVAGVSSLRAALPYILFHHERWDGNGYPTRRSGRGIPLQARLLAVADAFDAMTSRRPYRPALEIDAALDEVERCSGTQFDPEMARAFLEAFAAGEIGAPQPLAAATG
jgi:HD-GYP domain-containing protein (c-di-GMP phosphodiesterase class II)